LLLAERLLEDAEDHEKLATDGRLTDRMAEMAAVSLATLMRDAAQLPAGMEKTRAILGAADQLIRLRQTDRDFERSTREEVDWQRKQKKRAKCEQEEAETARRDEILKPLRVADRRKLLAAVYGGGEAAERRAWFETAVQFDLPRSNWEPPPRPKPGSSAPLASDGEVKEQLRHEEFKEPSGAAATPPQNRDTSPEIVAEVVDPGSAESFEVGRIVPNPPSPDAASTVATPPAPHDQSSPPPPEPEFHYTQQTDAEDPPPELPPLPVTGSKFGSSQPGHGYRDDFDDSPIQPTTPKTIQISVVRHGRRRGAPPSPVTASRPRRHDGLL
jgi:hypothetical protein